MYLVPPQPPEDKLRGCRGLAHGALLSLLLWIGIMLWLWWMYVRD